MRPSMAVGNRQVATSPGVPHSAKRSRKSSMRRISLISIHSAVNELACRLDDCVDTSCADYARPLNCRIGRRRQNVCPKSCTTQS